jgi:D-3-phosphoglycerate dehydrogenase / 2-oxoglutarate reductase
VTLRLSILNATCLDIFDSYSDWLTRQGVHVVSERQKLQINDTEFDASLDGANGIVVPAVKPIRADHMTKHPELQVISFASSGYEAADIDAATTLGIVVTNAIVQDGSEVVADQTWGLILSVARQIPHYNRLVQKGSRERGMGVAVYGKTLGIVGLGNIGKAVARRAAGWDMRVIACGLNPDLDFASEHGIELVGLPELLAQADFVSLHLRLAAETRLVIGERELALMKPSAFLINTARGELVDERELARALISGRIAGAGLDDPLLNAEHRHLMELPNVVCTPHLGNRAIEGVQAVTRCAMQNALDVLRGERPKCVVNPEVYRVNLRAPRPKP